MHFRGVQYFTGEQHKEALGAPDGPSQRVTGISDEGLFFEAPEEAKWASKELTGGSKPAPEAQPNRRQRRAFHSKAKKRVKQIIKQQDLRNAKYRAAVKANSTDSDGAPGSREDELRSHLR